MRIQYKGGVWKNTEDEILKAAVMKYGKNQWPRIASLLVRKSAKQCKARWFEWLDPSIKKTEWTREEEEKLLHLAKVMPTAWRTIAPMIGRTAAQCIEHYEQLIDNARQGMVGDDGNSSALAPPLSRPFDAEAPPETQPARPDPIDMDEDELEMLSEARARLSNTKGKKAKRKAREKQLEDAKRLAQLQKRRELKAAGVPLKKPKRNKNKTDYATEIPFFREPTAGFFDTLDEDQRADALMNKNSQIGKLLQKYKQKGFEQKEEENRRKDNAKRKKVLAENPDVAIRPNRSQSLQTPPLKRARFALPKPLLSDADLEKIVKAGNRPTLHGNEISQKHAERAVNLQDYRPPSASTGLPDVLSARSIEPWSHERNRRLQTLISIQSSLTPLYGGETPIHDLELNGRVTPTPSILRTPNTLASPSVTSVWSVDDSNLPTGESDAKKQKALLKELGEKVRNGLLSLPPPENDYEFDFNAVTEEEEDIVEDTHDLKEDSVRDAGEELRQMEKLEREQVPILRDRLLSSAAKYNLPIGDVNPQRIDPDSVEFLAQRDVDVQRIVKEFERGERKAYEVLNELRSLISSDGSDDIDRLQEAKGLVKEQMDEDGKMGSDLRTAILEELEKQVGEEITSTMKTSDVMTDECEGVDEIFKEEALRRKSVEDEIKVCGKWIEQVRTEPFELEKLWQRVYGSQLGQAGADACIAYN